MKRSYVVNIIFGVLFALFSAILVNLITGQNSPLVLIPFPIAALFLFFITGATVVFNIYEYRQSHRSSSPSEPPAREAENRLRLLERVHISWIEGVLQQSLHQEVRLELGLSEHTHALAWHLTLHLPEQSPRPLPHGTSILQVYDNKKELLILGEPGAGKTTLLLELAEMLLERARQDTLHPLPVLFPLSSWATQRLPLAEWMIEELYRKYQIPRPLAQAWVNQDQILPLFDGLDEVEETHRSVCVAAINTYRSDHGLVPTVVCSRSTEYFAQEDRLHLQCAVVIQPLSEAQVEDSLESLGGMDMLLASLRKDAILRELATAPLFLSIMVLACRGKEIAPRLLRGTKKERQQTLLSIYVQHVLQRHQDQIHWPIPDVLQWLHWLAKQMAHHNQTEFFFEDLQFDWYSRPRLARLFLVLVIGLLAGSLLGAVLDTANLTIAGNVLYFTEQILGYRWTYLILKVISTQQYHWSLGLLLGLAIGLAFSRDKIQPVEIMTWSWSRFRREWLVGGLGLGLVIGLVSRLVIGLVLGLVIGLVIGLVYGWRAFLAHWLLRLLLWQTNMTPRSYNQFLVFATRCTLLRRVGGGYIFLHRVLLEYFASPDVLEAVPPQKK